MQTNAADRPEPSFVVAFPVAQFGFTSTSFSALLSRRFKIQGLTFDVTQNYACGL